MGLVERGGEQRGAFVCIKFKVIPVFLCDFVFVPN